MRNSGIVLIVAVVVLVVAGLIIFPSIRIVDAGETCAIVRLGKVVGQADTGFQMVTPYITSFDCYPRQVRVYQTAQNAEGDGDWVDWPVEIKTADGQTAYVEFNITFSVDPQKVEHVRSNVASNSNDLVSRVVANYARSVPRDLGPEFTASELYGIGRVDFERMIGERLREIYAPYGVILDQFALRDITFDEAYEDAIEAQQIAREQIETEQFRADSAVYEAQRTAALAKGEADAEIARALGHAEAIRIEAAAEADAIKLQGEALQLYPEILKLEFIKALNTSQWMLIPWEDVQPFMPITP